jgi:spermidine synthase
VIRWEELGRAEVPGGGELRLMRRRDELSIMAGAVELMNSRMSGSEEVLAELACGPMAGRRGARVLIGGLGMGFTLRAALAVLGEDARVVVAELVPAVIEWAHGPMAGLFGDSLSDPRTEVRAADVAEAMSEGGFDAVLLDVDNGPDGLPRPENDRLYSVEGLAEAWDALTPGGVLAVWSAHPSPGFAARLSGAGFAVEEHAVRARRTKGARHVVWAAVKEG